MGEEGDREQYLQDPEDDVHEHFSLLPIVEGSTTGSTTGKMRSGAVLQGRSVTPVEPIDLNDY